MTSREKVERLEVLFARVSPDEAREIGRHLPTGLELPGHDYCRVHARYICLMWSLGYTGREAVEIERLTKV